MSQLLGIINRLKNLQEQGNGEEPVRRLFEVHGDKRCQVIYHPKKQVFELEVYQGKEKPQKYQFDNIDMIALEIYDLIQ